FNQIPCPTVAAWNAIISAHGQSGEWGAAIALFREMLLAGASPNEITFTAVLASCGHGGGLADGRHCFHSIAADFGRRAIADHYYCMIDLLGRAKQLRHAEELVAAMPYVPDPAARIALLSASCGDVERGARVADHLLQFSPENAASYNLISNAL
ncbi:hypothetical protein SELMODRAFT_72052, partial [Selaginella moellendorffii]